MTAPTSFGRIARVTQRPSGTTVLPDCVAWMYRETALNTSWSLTMIDETTIGQYPVAQVALEAEDFVAMAAGDKNGDGSDDLVMLTQNSQLAFFYENQRNGVVLAADRFTDEDYSTLFLQDEPGTSADVTSTPALVDLNQDGKADLFTVDRTTPRALAIQTDPPIALGPPSNAVTFLATEDPGHPCFLRSRYYSGAYFTSDCETLPNPLPQGWVELHLRNAWTGIPNPANGWVMEFTLYHQDTAVDAPVQPVPLSHYAYPMDLAPANGGCLQGSDLNGVFALNFPLEGNSALGISPEGEEFYDQKYYVIVRPIPPPGGESVPMTKYIIGITAEDRGFSPTFQLGMRHLLDYPGSWIGGLYYQYFNDPFGCIFSAKKQEIGGSVPLSRVPPYSGPPAPQPVPPAPGPVMPPHGGGN
jgi:hypothetical protein